MQNNQNPVPNVGKPKSKTREPFLKLLKSAEVEQLILFEPECFKLLYVIASRAKRDNDKSFSVFSLKKGEAFIGDYNNYNMSRQKYRTALLKLKAWGLISYRANNKGTIAKIIGSEVFDVNLESSKTEKSPENSANLPNHEVTTGKPSEKPCNSSPKSPDIKKSNQQNNPKITTNKNKEYSVLSKDNTGQAPDSFSNPDSHKKLLYDRARQYLLPHAKDPGAIITRWLKKYQKPATEILISLLQAEYLGVANPLSWIETRLKPEPVLEYYHMDSQALEQFTSICN